MDIIATLFSAYLDSVNSYANERVNSIMQMGNYNETAIRVEYDNELITYSHFRWNIRPESVCEHVQSNIVDRANCTKTAKQLFIALCENMDNIEAAPTYLGQMQGMYCRAANRYQPIVAEVSIPEESTELDEAKVRCNAAIAAAVGDPSRASERREACDAYRVLKADTR